MLDVLGVFNLLSDYQNAEGRGSLHICIFMICIKERDRERERKRKREINEKRRKLR